MPKKTRAIKITDIRGNKPWLKKMGISEYAIEKESKRRTFLIVCEGQTEVMYFKSFPVVTATIESVPLGCSKSALVECAKAMAEDEEYDEVWCVFDMDLKPDINGQAEDYNNAINSATSAGLNCAYSNDAFELWYILHYQYIEQEQPRTYYFKKLGELWKMNYERNGKSKEFTKKVYNLLEQDSNANQNQAILNAKKLFNSQKNKPFHQQNPVTKVFELVEILNKHLRK